MHSAEFGICNSVFATASFRGRDLESKNYAMLSAIQSVPTTLRI